MKQTLYHGSYLSVPAPLTGIGRRELDFGPGFYVTALREQAERWARSVCIIHAMNTPTLSVYEFDETNLPSDVRRLRLEHYDQEWLDFIVSSRRGEEPWKDYDIIEGGVANDQVIDTVKDYYAERITAEQAIGQLRFVKPTHQMCISRQTVVDRLNIDAERALDILYNSHTFSLLSNPESGLQLQSDTYILGNLLRELEV